MALIKDRRKYFCSSCLGTTQDRQVTAINPTYLHRRESIRRFSFLAAIMVMLFSRHLQADMPQHRMANLFIEDQGNQLVMSCHFFYTLLPQQFLLHEMQDKPNSLPTTDSRLLEQNLSAMARVAFDLKIDGRPVQPTLLKLVLYAGSSCQMVLSYPGRPYGNAELRAPILQYFPPGYMISVSISSTTGTKGAFFGKFSPPVMHFTQGAAIVPH